VLRDGVVSRALGGGGSAFMPLSFGPAEAYQSDWSQVLALICGVTTTVKVAHMNDKSNYSGLGKQLIGTGLATPLGGWVSIRRTFARTSNSESASREMRGTSGRFARSPFTCSGPGYAVPLRGRGGSRESH
jgi:hypothetical protein